MKAPLGFFDNNASGLLRNRLDGAASETETLLAHNLADIVGTIAMFLTMLVLMFVFDWRMGAACLLAAVISVIAMFSMMGGKNAGLMAEYHVALEGWGPLGQGNREMLEDPVIGEIARAHGRSSGDVILRFELQENAIIFPKSTKPERMKSNLAVFDFSLSEEDLATIRTLDRGHGVHDPDAPGVAEYLISAFDVHAND